MNGTKSQKSILIGVLYVYKACEISKGTAGYLNNGILSIKLKGKEKGGGGGFEECKDQ